jgi:hypothetical protein
VSDAVLQGAVDPQPIWRAVLFQPGSKPFKLIAEAAFGEALAVADSLAAVAAAPESVTLARNSGGIGYNNSIEHLCTAYPPR